MSVSRGVASERRVTWTSYSNFHLIGGRRNGRAYRYPHPWADRYSFLNHLFPRGKARMNQRGDNNAGPRRRNYPTYCSSYTRHVASCVACRGKTGCSSTCARHQINVLSVSRFERCIYPREDSRHIRLNTRHERAYQRSARRRGNARPFQRYPISGRQSGLVRVLSNFQYGRTFYFRRGRIQWYPSVVGNSSNRSRGGAASRGTPIRLLNTFRRRGACSRLELNGTASTSSRSRQNCRNMPLQEPDRERNYPSLISCLLGPFEGGQNSFHRFPINFSGTRVRRPVRPR